MQNCIALGAGSGAALAPSATNQIAIGGPSALTYVGSLSTVGAAAIAINPTGTGTLAVGSCTITAGGGASTLTAPSLTASSIRSSSTTVANLQLPRPVQLTYSEIDLTSRIAVLNAFYFLGNINLNPGKNVWYCTNPVISQNVPILIPNPPAGGIELVILFNASALSQSPSVFISGNTATFIAKYVTGAPVASLRTTGVPAVVLNGISDTAEGIPFPQPATFICTSFNLISDGTYWIQQ